MTLLYSDFLVSDALRTICLNCETFELQKQMHRKVIRANPLTRASDSHKVQMKTINNVFTFN